MDWVKIKVKHILFSDLEPTQIGTLVSLQALTAAIERIPTRKEMTKHVHHRQLKSLENALVRIAKESQELVKDDSYDVQELVKDSSRSLQDILKKVLRDVQEVHEKRVKNNERKRKSRSNNENVTRDTNETSRGCPIREEERREDKSREENKKEEVVQQDSVDKTVDPPPSQNHLPKNYLKETQEIWNGFAEKHGLSPIRQINDQRRAGIKARLKEPEFDIGEVFREIESSSFLRGENNRGWKVDFDFVFCSSSNWLKIVEGKYRGSGNGKKTLSMEEMWDALG